MNQNNYDLMRELKNENATMNSLLLFIVLSVIVSLLTWSYYTELDVVVRGQGKTVSENQNQMVQTPEAGIIIERGISEGQFVEAGTVMFEIELIELNSQLEQIVERLSLLDIKKQRLEAESKNTVFNATFDQPGAQLGYYKNEKALFDAKLNSLNTSYEVLEQRLLQKRLQIEELEIQKRSLEKNLEFLQSEIETIEPLVKASLAPETRLLALMREKESLNGEVNLIPTKITQLYANISEIEKQILAERNNYLTGSLKELSTLVTEIEELNSRIPVIKERLSRSLITSPIDGIVNRIPFQSTDAYVKTGDVVAELVPINEDLIIEAQIDPKDIAKIKLKDEVKVSFTAFDVTKYGRLSGEVINISPDAMTNNETGAQYYSVDVRMLESYENNDDIDMNILPGMVSTIEILSGSRTILDYFWQPVVKGMGEAFKE